MKRITKFVITGGPCSGKTTLLQELREHFSKLGYRVLGVTETATELLNGGISPFNMDNVTFQYIVTSIMRYKEEMMLLAAKTVPEEKVLIVCDRAQMDNTAYMTDAEFESLLTRLGLSRVEMRDGYEAVFHLETSAKADGDIYDTNKGNNNARYETMQEAVRVDDRIIQGWTGHPHFRIIPTMEDFGEKTRRLNSEVEHFLGIDGSTEIERSFLVEMPSQDVFDSLPFCRAIEIEQCYVDLFGEKTRIRKRGEDGHYVYFSTEKKGCGITRIEKEERISEQDYMLLKKHADCTLQKTRYCFVWKKKYFELDVYPFSSSLARLELELLSPDEEFEIPTGLHVIKEVTGIPEYTNHQLAKTKKLEA